MEKTAIDLLSVANPVFKSYLLWSAILVLKVLVMSSLTSIQRFRKKIFSNPEDLVFLKLLRFIASPDENVKYDDPDIERVRRAHRNDLENILPFLSIGLLYVLINPEPLVAINLFRVIGIARILHTLVYAIFVFPQPTRALLFFIALFPTVYMAIAVIIYCV